MMKVEILQKFAAATMRQHRNAALQPRAGRLPVAMDFGDVDEPISVR